jgi:hypothetical protein
LQNIASALKVNLFELFEGYNETLAEMSQNSLLTKLQFENEALRKENAELKVNIAKADVLVEGFQSMLTTGGVYLKDIITESEKVAKPDLSIELDAKIMENKALKDQINGFKREQVLAKLTEGLTAPQKDSVLKIQKHLNFVNEEKFTAQLSQIVETAKVKPDIKESSKINENKSVSTGLTSDTHQRFF